MKVVFQNVERSEFVEDVVLEKIEHVAEKFPEFLRRASATVSVSMDNSRTKAGKDVFGVKLMLHGAHKDPLVIQKAAMNVYEAAAILADRLLEFLSRASHKKQKTKRHLARVTKYKERWQAPIAS